MRMKKGMWLLRRSMGKLLRKAKLNKIVYLQGSRRGGVGSEL